MSQSKHYIKQPDPQHICLCQFSNNPFDDCYCRKVTGLSIPFITKYCMDKYHECPIYKKSSKYEKSKDVSAVLLSG
ncbi:MAG: hypothetical protein HQK72_12930 [Desulfamplus sp.]|nr:hypothetical protein [Desulfamplus sp.]